MKWMFLALFSLVSTIVEANERVEVKREVYGDYTIILFKDGKQTIYGSGEAPALPPIPSPDVRHVIFVDFKTRSLMDYRVETDGSLIPGKKVPVVSPLPESLPKDVVRGRVIKIDRNPTWCPPTSLQREYGRNCIPPGDPKNAMGAVKFLISWQIPGWEAIRLHGALVYPEAGKFATEETSGCVRLLDSEILKLVERIGENAVKEGIEVIFYR